MEKRGRFSLSSLSRSRWNLLDLIGAVGRRSVPTYIFSDVDASWAENLRTKYQRLGRHISLNAILLKAIGIAQRAHPLTRTIALPGCRAAVLNDIAGGFTIERYVDSVAGNLGSHCAGGAANLSLNPSVFFGTIQAPDAKGLEEISKELRTYAEADISSVQQLDQQSKFLKLPHFVRRLMLWAGMRDPEARMRYLSATFALTSIGKFGCKLLIPPCVCTVTFGVGAVEQRAVVREGKIEARPVFTLALNFDHHVIDGAPAARFLKDICALLEGGLETYLLDEELASREESTKPSTSAPVIG